MERENTNTITISVQTPLLQTNGTHQQIIHHHHNNNVDQQQQDEVRLEQQEIRVGVDGDEDDTQLDKTLQRLEFYLTFLGFNQTTPLRFVVSWVVFLVVGVAVPVLILEFTLCSGCEAYRVKDFEYDVLTSQVLLAAVSLICVSHNLRKKGIRKFLFVDRYRGHVSRFMDQYIKKIRGSYRMMLLSLFPCCILKWGHEIMRALYVQNQSWEKAVLVVVGFIISWTYLSAITLAACILFHLVCTLQIIHFNDYGKLLERESDILVLMEEHIRLRHYLSKISHRFRIYLLLVFLFVTASQFVTLVQILGLSGTVTFLNGGNFAVTSIVQVVATLLCLHAATKISHRAQGIAAVASKWHAYATCRSFEGGQRSNSAESVNRSISASSLASNFSESDIQSLDGFSLPTRAQFASVSSYNKRQSFVMYLQMNPGGITLYGWTVDRALLTTMFCIELSLVLFVLDQTIIFSSNTPTT